MKRKNQVLLNNNAKLEGGETMEENSTIKIVSLLSNHVPWRREKQVGKFFYQSTVQHV